MGCFIAGNMRWKWFCGDNSEPLVFMFFQITMHLLLMWSDATSSQLTLKILKHQIFIGDTRFRVFMRLEIYGYCGSSSSETQLSCCSIIWAEMDEALGL